MEQVDQRLDARVEQGVDEALVEVEAGLVDGAGPRGQDARPADAEPVGARPELGHQPDVLRVAVVVVAGDVARAAVGDRARLGGQRCPRSTVLGRPRRQLPRSGRRRRRSPMRSRPERRGPAGLGRCRSRVDGLTPGSYPLREDTIGPPRRPSWSSGIVGPVTPTGDRDVRSARVTSVVQSPRFGDDWWQRGVVYQIYPRSFADTTATGSATCPGSSTTSTTSARRASGSTRSGCRRSTRRRGSISATTSAITNGSIRCSGRRRTSTGSSRRRTGAGSGSSSTWS